MKKLISALLLLLLLAQTPLMRPAVSAQEAAKSIQPSPLSATPLGNQEIIRMVQAGFTPETILFTIKSSASNFVTTPAALQQLKEEGVPDAVILAMVMAPRSTPVNSNSPAGQKAAKVVIPNG